MVAKRTSAAHQSAAPAKKAKTRAPEAPVLDFLGKCDEIPKPCREMLQAALPICLEVVEAERHKFQVEVLDRVAGLLANVEAKKREVVSGHEAELAEIEAEKNSRNTDTEQKKAVSASKQAECDEKGKVVDAAKEVSDAAQKKLNDAQAAEAEFNKKKDGLHAEQENFAKLLAEGFVPLKEGTLQGNWRDRNKKVDEMKKKLKECGAQDSLGDALAATLKMSPEKREGTFAKATMEFAEDYFKKHTAKVAADIAGLDAEAATHKAAIASAEGVLAEKKGILNGLEKEWDLMQDDWVKLENSAAEAAKGLSQTEARIPRVNKNIDKAKHDLEKFMEVPALFASLKEKSTAAEPEEAEAEEENAGEGEKADEEM